MITKQAITRQTAGIAVLAGIGFSFLYPYDFTDWSIAPPFVTVGLGTTLVTKSHADFL